MNHKRMEMNRKILPDQTIQRFAGNLASKMTVWIRSQFIFGRFLGFIYFCSWSLVWDLISQKYPSDFERKPMKILSSAGRINTNPVVCACLQLFAVKRNGKIYRSTWLQVWSRRSWCWEKLQYIDEAEMAEHGIALPKLDSEDMHKRSQCSCQQIKMRSLQAYHMMQWTFGVETKNTKSDRVT